MSIMTIADYCWLLLAIAENRDLAKKLFKFNNPV